MKRRLQEEPSEESSPLRSLLRSEPILGEEPMEGGEEPIEGGELGQLVDGEGVVGSGIVHGGSSVLPSTDGISTGVSHVVAQPAATGVVGVPHVVSSGSHFVAPGATSHYVHHYTTVSHKTVAVPVPAPVKKVKTLVRNHYGTVYRTDPSASRTPYLCKLPVGKAVL